MKKTFLLFVILFFSLKNENRCKAQDHELDSLYTVFKNTSIADSTRLQAIDDIAWNYNSNQPDTAILLAEQELEFALDKKNKKYEALAHSTMGTCYVNKNIFAQALEQYLITLKINEELKDKKRIAICYVNIGNVYNHQLNLTKAMQYYFLALKKQEALHLPEDDVSNKFFLSTCYGNIGTIYSSQKNYKRAIEYQLITLKLKIAIDDYIGIADCYQNLGVCYTNIDDYKIGFEYIFKALKLSKEIGYLKGIGASYSNLSGTYNDIDDYEKSIIYIDSALQISKQLGDLDLERHSYYHLASSYSLMGNYKQAYINEVKFKNLNDSIFNVENSKQLGDIKTNFEVEKKSIELKTIAKAESKKQNLILLFVGCGLFLVLIFAAFIFRSLHITRKQKLVIEQKEKETQKQKHIIEEKQKEITDSINYAKRIQYSFLAHHDLLKENLNQHFVLFMPKDIVSGDFYWAIKKEDSFYLAVCDCTGHGVPGAFMSLLNINYLNEAVIEKNIFEPNEIFNYVRKKLTSNTEGGKDGMDATLIRFKSTPTNDGKQNVKLTYASANNKPILISSNNLIDLSADKMPVGKGEKHEPFTLFELNVNTGDTLYFFTDGYVDQFGGQHQKKLTRKNFKNVILSVQDKSMAEQQKEFEKFILDYKNDVEQIDDILVMGVRI